MIISISPISDVFYPDQVERYYGIINQTQDLAYEISITAQKLLEIRAKLP